MNIVLFEDSWVDRLYPITLSRPAYAVTCGALRLVDVGKLLAKRHQGKLFSRVRPLVEDMQQDFLQLDPVDPNESTLWLNARLVPERSLLTFLESVIESEPFQLMVDHQLAVAKTLAGTPSIFADESKLHHLELPHLATTVRLLEYPHDVIVPEKSQRHGHQTTATPSG